VSSSLVVSFLGVVRQKVIIKLGESEVELQGRYIWLHSRLVVDKGRANGTSTPTTRPISIGMFMLANCVNCALV
jgi:hypothetical protein